MRDPNEGRHEIVQTVVNMELQGSTRGRLVEELRRMDGSKVPEDAVIFETGEIVAVKGCLYKIQKIKGRKMVLRAVTK